MNSKGRIENTLRNSVMGVGAQIVTTVMGLIVRTVFIHQLSADYLGVNGLFSNILTMLSLAELGVGSAIVFSMYKPIATNDKRTVAKLMNLYSKAYNAIGIVVAIVGLCIIPFLKYIIKDQPNISGLKFIYLLYLLNTVLSYLFAYKRSIFQADQRARVITAFDLVFNALKSVGQICVLLLTGNFLLYLVIQIVCTFLENIFISIYANHEYAFLKEYRTEKLTKEEQKPILDHIKALFIYKIGSTALDGTDNIIISAFDGVISVGLLSNYSLVTGSIQMILGKITSALTGSVGNFIAKEKHERYEEILNHVTFLHFVLYGMIFVGSIAVLNPLISVWAGKEYLLDDTIVFTNCLNIYIFGMMNAIWIFRSTMGLFIYGKWRPLVSAVLNIVVSIVLAKIYGLLGVLMGTTITRVATNVWFDSLIVYRYGLKKSPLIYFRKWIYYLLMVLVDIWIVSSAKNILVLDGIWSIIVYGVLAVVVFLASLKIVFGHTKEYKYAVAIIKRN